MVERIQNGNDILSYTYDNLGNIETISENGELKATYHYDELNQLIREDNLYLNKSISYSYDTGGNILSVSEYAYTTGELGEVAAVKTYGYEDVNWKDKLTSYNGQSITYDAIGNPLQYRDGMNLTWQNGRQLASINDNITYQYNDGSIRTQKTVNGVTTNYYLNGSTILSQVTGSDQMDFYYDDTGNLFGFSLNGASYYYVKNLQNDIIGILDSDGSQVVSYVYNSWGKLISTSGSLVETVGVQNPFRYRGYYYDQETGFYYLQSRYYDPETERFINSDSISGIVGDFLNRNVYSYCENNPINMVDSSGTFAIAISITIGGLVQALVTTAVIILATVAVAYIAAQIQSYVESKPKIEPKNQSVYVLRDNKGDVRYVGRSKDPTRREKQHQNDPLHPQRKTYKMEVVVSNLNKKEARAFEQMLISAYMSKHIENSRREIAKGNVDNFKDEAGKAKEIFNGYLEDEITNLDLLDFMKE